MKNQTKTYVSDIAFTPAVKAFQEIHKSRRNYEKIEEFGGWQSKVTPQLASFLETMDSFYFSTATADGQPYVQHRGGPKGFLKIIDSKTLAFTDFIGNKQYISIGNLSENNKAYIFLMDYANQTRVKIWGTAKVVTGNDELERSFSDTTYNATVERTIIFTIEAWDKNCRQHIVQRFTQEDISKITTPLQNKIKELKTIIKANLF